PQRAQHRTGEEIRRAPPPARVGAVLCALGLFFMPLSHSILMAVSMLWILDAGNNITMEPYRAYVSDRLNEDQHQLGFLTQSSFTGLAQMLAFLTPSLLVWAGMNQDWVDGHNIPYTARIAFMVGAFLSFGTIVYSILRVPELPLSLQDRARIAAAPKGLAPALREIGAAIRDMPPAMRKLALMSLFQWYAMFTYWNYVVLSISRSVYGQTEAVSEGFRRAVLDNGEMGGFYNGVAFVAAFAMIPILRKASPALLHAACLLAAGVGMFAIPHIADKAWLFLPAAGIGLGWASMMGNPYIILASSIPPNRTGVYMGIFNMMIVIPMLLNALTMPLYFDTLLGGDARNALMLAGVLMAFAAVSVLWLRPPSRASRPLSAA
ncbi:MAG: MFS transporter, partial [Oxalobacteraceae bacterium]